MLGRSSQFTMCFSMSHFLSWRFAVWQLASVAFTAYRQLLLPTLLIQVSSTRSWDRISLFVKIHSKIESHAMKHILDLGQ